MSELLRGTEQRQRRTLVGIGATVVAIAVLASLAAGLLPARRPAAAIDITVLTPTVGQGIDTQSKVVLHGMTVGTITAVERHGEAAELRLQLDTNSVHGLTDGFDFDFRPANAWGLSALNLVPRQTGSPLSDGARIDRTPVTNATMSQLLSGQMTFVTGVFTDNLTRLIRNSSDYTTALLPAVESGLIIMNLVAETQRDTPAALLRKLNALTTPTPDVVDTMLTGIHNFRHQQGGNLLTDDIGPAHETLAVIAPDAVAIIAAIISDHRTELTPATELARSLLDSFSMIFQRSRESLRLDKLLAGLQAGYFGGDDESARFRLVLEALPALESGMPAPVSPDGTGGR